MTDTRLPSANPSLGTYPHLQKLVRKEIDWTVHDIRTLLLLHPDQRGPGGNCEIATAAVLFNLIGGLSVLVFEASEEGLREAKGRGRRFRAMLRAHYPWGQETTAPGAAIEVLYDYARNQMAHSLGLGLGTSLRSAPDYGYAKPRLTPRQLAELETAQQRPAWAQPTVYSVDLSAGASRPRGSASPCRRSTGASGGCSSPCSPIRHTRERRTPSLNGWDTDPTKYGRARRRGQSASPPTTASPRDLIWSDLLVRHITKEVSAMDHVPDHIADHQRRVLDFALDTVGLQHARPEAERTLSELRLRQTVAVLRAENRALRARLDALERQLYPGDADPDVLEREVDHRAARARARQPGI